MNQILKDIDNGKYDDASIPKQKAKTIKAYQRKKDWYKIGEVLLRGHKVKLYKEGLVTA